jgi:hypothetical protein
MNEANTSDDEIDRILERIRSEVARRNAVQSNFPANKHVMQHFNPISSRNPTGSGAFLTGNSDDIARPAPVHVQLVNTGFRPREVSFRPNLDGRYRLKDLLRYEDREFIQAAYLAILRRPADEKGLDDYLRLLRAGREKAAILGSLRASLEGRRAASTITGLRWHTAIANVARLPFLGWFIRLAVAVFELPNARLRERVLEGRIHAINERDRARSLESLNVINRALRDLEEGVNEVAAYTKSKVSEGTNGKVISSAGKNQHAVDV